MRRQSGLTPGAPLVASSVLVVLLAGCSSESTQPLPPGPLVNDTPAHALQLFATVYGEQDLGDYSALLTGDFHAAFSATTDPDLVEIFGTTWRRADEIAATRHLFDGFLDETGTPMPGLSSLVVSLRSTQLILDPNHPDSVAHYVVAQVDTIEFTARAASTGSNDPFRFLASHRFWFVRGDAAVLDSTQA